MQLVSIFLFPVSVFAQEVSTGGDQMWRSKDLDNRFYGYFFPPAYVDGENFKTCEDQFIRVLIDEVERVEVAQECGGEPTPFKVMEWAELARQVDELSVVNVNNDFVGSISEVYLSKTGGVAGFLLKKSDGEEYLSVAANDLSVWSTPAGSVALLVPERPDTSVVPGIFPMGDEEFNRKVFSSYTAAVESLSLQDIVSVNLKSATEGIDWPVSDGIPVFVSPYQ